MISFSLDKTRPPSLYCGYLLTSNWSKMPARGIVSHVQTASSGGERFAVVSARFRWVVVGGGVVPTQVQPMRV